jgi:threonine dehydratase
MNDLFRRIQSAQRALAPYLAVTPLVRSVLLSRLTGCEVYLKCEHLQQTGSFKARGATHKLLALGEQARVGGVITASTGNHGQGVAWAGRKLGVPVTVYLPENVSRYKLDVMRELGADVVLVAGDPLLGELEARRVAASRGIPYVAPYNDLDVVAGQGTAGLEMTEQCADLDAIFVTVGGGGLMSGIGTAFKSVSPRTRVVGAWPRASTCMYRSLDEGRIVSVEEADTLSDSSTGNVEPGSVTFELCRAVIDERVLIDEPAIRAAMRLLAENERWIVEGAAGVAFAALLEYAATHPGQKLCAVVCGRNIMLDRFMEAVR